MNMIRTAALRPTAPVSAPGTGVLRSWSRFWFAPADTAGLHILRVLAGLLFLAWLLPFAGHQDALFGLHGWFDQKAYSDMARLPDGPQLIGWSALYLCGGDPFRLTVAYSLAVGVLVLFTLGVWPRLTALLTWVVVVSFTANPATEVESDCLLRIIALYLAFGYLLYGQWGRNRSWLWRLLGPAGFPLLRRTAWKDTTEPATSVAANLAVRLLQANLAILLVTAGLHKLQYGEWWSGVSLWYPLHPAFTTTVKDIRALAPNAATVLTFLSAAGYAVLAWQIGFPLFAWRPRWRVLVIGGGVVGWLGTAFLYGVPVFGPALLLACLSFLSPGEWRGLLSLLGKAPGLRRLNGTPTEAPANLDKAEALVPVAAGRDR